MQRRKPPRIGMARPKMARVSRRSRRSETVALLRRELLALSSVPVPVAPAVSDRAALENWANEGGASREECDT